MAEKDKKRQYEPELTDMEDEEYTLEEILEEYGGGSRRILQEAAQKAAEELPPEWAEEAPEEESEPKNVEIPPAPRPVTLEDVVNSTVSAVMEEQRESAAQPDKSRKKGLFSRCTMRTQEETEELFQTAMPEPPVETEEERIGPEPELSEMADRYFGRCKKSQQVLLPAFLAAILPLTAMAAEQYGGVTIPYWSGDGTLQVGVFAICLLMNLILCRGVISKAIRMLEQRHCVSEQLIVLAALVSLGDCAVYFLSEQRQAVPPYTAVCNLALLLAQWGVYRENRGNWDCFRAAALDGQPPYSVTDTVRGACKQQGLIRGFYTMFQRDGFAVRWQTALLPLVLAASLVFAGLTSIAKHRNADFLLNWSAILTAGGTFSLALCWTVPWSRVSRRLQKTGCAVAGWDSADRISHHRNMVITDGDLFPPGTIQLNGVKVYGEELGRAAAYAAAMAYAAGSGVVRLFDGLAVGENARRETADDFSFYQEGGWSATIRGESVLLGTASFMRKMDVRLPGGLDLKTGMFLSVDGELTAVFAVKYVPSENVDFALRMMRRSRIIPILAARDPNVTPALLKRKFYKKVKVKFPELTERVALSEAEQDRGLPRALLMREGLLPYAEVVVGSHRLCSAVRKATLLSLAGSMIGTLLAAYLVNLQAFTLLTPVSLTTFLALWTIPVILLSDWAGRY